MIHLTMIVTSEISTLKTIFIHDSSKLKKDTCYTHKLWITLLEWGWGNCQNFHEKLASHVTMSLKVSRWNSIQIKCQDVTQLHRIAHQTKFDYKKHHKSFQSSLNFHFPFAPHKISACEENSWESCRLPVAFQRRGEIRCLATKIWEL